MAPPYSIQFVETALSSNSPFAPSYKDAEQKWIIRDHLLSLLQDFPTFIPSTDTFIHDDGATVYLLNASGSLLVSHAKTPVPLTIWLHQNYPYSPPIVLLTMTPSTQVLPHYPFVNRSGAITSAYLQTWLYPRSNLSDLAHNLARLFAYHHPFFYSSSPIFSSFTDPSLASKMEALDHLAGALHYDMIALQARVEEDIEGLSILQKKLDERDDITTTMILGLDHERMSLKQKVRKMEEEADMLQNWLRVHDFNSVGVTARKEMEEAFEAADKESELLLDCFAEDLAIEDLVYALDKALEEGVLTFGKYIKQVRTLAREQFYPRAKWVKLRSSDTSLNSFI